MCEQYIRVVFETAYPDEDDDNFVVHAFKEEDHGPRMSLEGVLTRVIERLSTSHRFRILARVIDLLDRPGRSASSRDRAIVSAEEDLIIAARRLLKGWARSTARGLNLGGDCADKDLVDDDFEP